MKTFFLSLICLLTAVAMKADNSIAKGDSCLKNYDVKHALNYYEVALKSNDNVALREKIAECYYRQNRWAKVIDTLEPAPDDSLSHDAMRQLFYSNKQLAKASAQQAWGREIIARWQMDGEIVAELAKSYLVNERTDEAEKLCNDYWMRDEGNNAVNSIMADIYMVQKQWQLAKDSYLLLLQQGDSTYKNLFNLGACYEHMPSDDYKLRKDLTQKAKESFEAAIKVSLGTQPGAMFHLAVLLNSEGDSKQAKAYFESALKLLQPDPNIMFTCYRGLGESYYAEQNWQQANYAFQDALKYMPDSYTTTYYLGITYQAMSDPSNAFLNYNAFLQHAESMKEQTEQMKEMIADAQKRRSEMAKKMHWKIH